METFAALVEDVPDPFKAFKKLEVPTKPILEGLVQTPSPTIPWWVPYNKFEIVAPCTVTLMMGLALAFARCEKLRKDSKK